MVAPLLDWYAVLDRVPAILQSVSNRRHYFPLAESAVAVSGLRAVQTKCNRENGQRQAHYAECVPLQASGQ